MAVIIDLNARLAQLKSLFVIARASAARFSLAQQDASTYANTRAANANAGNQALSSTSTGRTSTP